MSSMDELRRMLDERGVEHTDFGGMTEWANEYRRICRAYTRPEPLTVDVAVLAVPPEQAIAATLGAGTCHKLPSSGDTVCIVRTHKFEKEFGYWKCSECGCECFEGARYCMNCGRKVVK